MARADSFKLNLEGFEEVRHDPRAVAMLHATAHAIAEACGEGYVVKEQPGKHRARVIVTTGTWEAKHDEAEHNNLLRNLDAGRLT